jgi:hypothetical protein
MGDSETPAEITRPEHPPLVVPDATKAKAQKTANRTAKLAPSPPPPPTTPELTYYFSMTAPLKTLMRDSTVGFDVPEGTRLHIQYDSASSSVETDYDAYRDDWLRGPALAELHALQRMPSDKEAKALSESGDLEWFGLKGAVLSGGDWALVQKNGVVTFDARVTLKTGDGFLVDAVFSGQVDLRTVLTPPATGDRGDLGWVYDSYLNNKPADPQLPIALAVRFEAADQPHLRQGEDDSWIRNSRYAAQGRYFWKYQRLVRGQFIGRGALTIKTEQRSPVESISLHVYEIG